MPVFLKKEGWNQGCVEVEQKAPRIFIWLANGMEFAQILKLLWTAGFFSYIFPVWIRMSITVALCLTHHCMLGADNFFLRNCAPGIVVNVLCPEPHHT